MADFKIDSANYRGKQLIAERKIAEAKFAEAEVDGNDMYAAEQLSEMHRIDAEGAWLNQQYNAHIASQQPRQREPESGNEFLAKPAHKMGGDDALAIVNYGKHQSDPTWLSAEDYNKQQRELLRLKAQGMYRD